MTTHIGDEMDQHLSDPRRLVSLEAVHNFRDLGGYPSTRGTSPRGSMTRWEVLYRADGLYRLTEADIEVMRGLGLHTVVDLRSHRELAEHGTFPHDQVAVDFTHFPVIDTTWNPDDIAVAGSDHDFLVWAYRSMLVEGSARFAAAIEQLAAPGALPAVFHCAAGKDRTGILAALLLGSLDVSRDYILADYALTAEGMDRMRAWAVRQFPEMVDRMNDAPSAFLASLPEAMGELLDGIVTEHGSVREFVRSIGVSDAAIESLAAQLLVPVA